MGEGWSAQGISVRLNSANDPPRADIEVTQLALPKLQLKFGRSRIRCGTFAVSDDAYVCNDAMVAVTIPELGAQQLQARFRYERRSGVIETTLKGTQNR